jgi:hypothetical protein
VAPAFTPVPRNKTFQKTGNSKLIIF